MLSENHRLIISIEDKYIIREPNANPNTNAIWTSNNRPTIYSKEQIIDMLLTNSGKYEFIFNDSFGNKFLSPFLNSGSLENLAKIEFEKRTSLRRKDFPEEFS